MTHHEHVATTDHIQYLSRDPAATRRFFQRVVGFHFDDLGEGMGHYLMRNDKFENGSGTGVGGLQTDELPSTIAFVTVQDLEEALKVAKAEGAKIVMDKTELQGLGWHAVVHAPGDLQIGLFQSK
jgi:predicted enzyme related to lactoylglutathione lyase